MHLVFRDLPPGSSGTVGTKLPVLPDVRPELGLHLALTLELITQLFVGVGNCKVITTSNGFALCLVSPKCCFLKQVP